MRILLSLLALAVVGISTTVAHSSLDVEPKVSLARGANLDQTVSAVATATRGVVVADAGSPRRTLQQDLAEASLSQALDRVSRDFDCYWVRRGNALALQDRLLEPDDQPFLEIEELRRAADDWAKLMRPFAVRVPPLELIELQSSFLQSLSPEQLKQAQSAGVPISSLPRLQKDALLRINAQHAWDDADRELNRLRIAFENWDRISVVNKHPNEPVRELALPLPTADGDLLVIPYVRPERRRLASPKPEGLSYPSFAGKLPDNLSQVFRIPTQTVTLGELLEQLGIAGDIEVEAPDYALGRKLRVCSVNSNRLEVLSAICDLWGWVLTSKGGKYRLSQPISSRGTGALELHRNMYLVTPPSLIHQARAFCPPDSATAHMGRDLEETLREIEMRNGPGWDKVRVATLSLDGQRRLANVMAWWQYYGWFSRHGRYDKPPSWIVAPEKGLFQLLGDMGPNKHPLARIVVEDEHGKTSWWGWKAGTAKVEAYPSKTQ